MYGDRGDDTYYVDAAGDRIFEVTGEGYDTAITSVSYTLAVGVSVELLRTYGSATTQAIDLTGNELANTLVGNASVNRLNGGGGADEMWGHAGDDVYYIDNAGDRMVELAGQGYDSAVTSVSFTLAGGVSVEILETSDVAGTQAIDLTGNELANTLVGNAGANRLNGAAGADVLRGGLGDDTYIVDDSGDAVVELVNQGHDSVATNVSYALTAGASVEVLRIWSTATTHTIDLTGNELVNLLIGNDGINLLNGGDGNDELWGYGGGDFLTGGAGDDVLTGGQGADRFIVGQGTDTIKDFVQGQDRVFLQTGQTIASLTQVGANVEAVLSDGARVVFSNLTTAHVSTDDFFS